ncbi:MAG: hypothetical protein GC184_05085 [Rhizobiales bacterium]|nr:hypothetical protein [Hyphomicrobiales bacterium]
MGILSRLKSLRQGKPEQADETPPVSREALARVMRGSTGLRGSLSAAELGQTIATALSTIETAVLAIDALAERLRECADLLADAARHEDLGRRALLAGRYDDLRSEIDAIAGTASHNRINLICGRLIDGRHASFSTALDGEGRAVVALPIVNLTTAPEGLALSPPRNALADDEEIEQIAAEIEKARDRILQVSEHYADHAALIADRLARLQVVAGNRSMASYLPTGADHVDPEAAAKEAAPAKPAKTDSQKSLIDIGIDEVETKLRAINERIAQKAESQSATPDETDTDPALNKTKEVTEEMPE